MYEEVTTLSRFMTLAEVAQYFAVSRSTIRRRYTKDGPGFDERFPTPVHAGRAIRFIRDEIVQYADLLCTERKLAVSKVDAV
ncbi:helix-turn-helix transcriptional regulator [Acidithiobacillus sp. AMEEHan]|uniref:helix-turn-helix transcriptional regulator n=1 Tax=Acidithiobacillus sp. AMEEHan TaxID=2994951 RepID=UPI0035B08756